MAGLMVTEKNVCLPLKSVEFRAEVKGHVAGLQATHQRLARPRRGRLQVPCGAIARRGRSDGGGGRTSRGSPARGEGGGSRHLRRRHRQRADGRIGRGEER